MTEMSVKEGLTAMEIASYLRRHPGFLGEFPDIALTLLVPREQGSTTSLASYQLEVLRDKNQELNRRLHELIETATDNEQLVVRVHSLTVALMREKTLGDTVRRVVAGLTEDFHNELVRLALFRAPSDDLPNADWLITAARGDKRWAPFDEFLERTEPLCGRLQPEKLDTLFGEKSSDVKSAVLVPIDGIGMLAIGSSDANRFHPGMGTVFLKLIAEAIAAAIGRFA
ncbi:MAG TPA: DUF484 family protein [Rudaea sp.]|jgi:hypothetical protein|nr:DUF484 family protein [Rudaea sp.]